MTEQRTIDALMQLCQQQKARIAELEAQLTLQPCGHPASAIRRGEEVAPGQFVHWCSMCEEEARA